MFVVNACSSRHRHADRRDEHLDKQPSRHVFFNISHVPGGSGLADHKSPSPRTHRCWWMILGM